MKIKIRGNIVILIMVLIFFSNSGFAQNKKDFSMSLNAGASISSFTNRNPFYRLNKNDQYAPINTHLVNDALWSFSLNLGLEYYLNEKISINSGIGYDRKGISIDFDSAYCSEIYDSKSEINYQRNISNYYFIIPITFRKYFFNNNSLFLEGGIYGGIHLYTNVNGKEYRIAQYGDETPSLYSSEYEFILHNEHTDKFDFGLSFGIGYQLHIRKMFSLISKLNFNYGLRKVDALNNNEVNYYPSGTNLPKVIRENYYGLNSNAKNLSAVFTIGIAYTLN